MKNFFFLSAVFILSILAFSCSEDFAPYTNVRSGYMLYCVLDNRFGGQIAALQKIHVPGTEKTMPKGVRIMLAESGGYSYYFKDTLIKGNDNFSFYYLPGFTPTGGVVYRITAMVDSTEIQYGQITYCSNTDVNILYTKLNDKLGYYVNCYNTTINYATYKIFIEYENNSTKEKGIVEAPIRISVNPNDCLYSDSLWAHDYSKISAVYSEMFELPMKPAPGPVLFEEVLYYTLKHKMPKNSNPDNIKITKAYAVVYGFYDPLFSARKSLYSYKSYSLRLGEASMLTNIISEDGEGNGFMGAIVGDTVKFKMRTGIIKRFGYLDGQPK